MSIQELLTYVEELSFKTSMIGYDKDEVDIQLDKICDEIEAIVKEKDDEIAALRSGAPAAPVVVDLEQKEEKTARTEVKEPEEDQDDYAGKETLKAQIKDLEQKLAAAEQRAYRAEEKVEEIRQKAFDAETQAEVAESKLNSLESQLAEARAEAEECKKAMQAAGAMKKGEPVAEAKAGAASPSNADEAYQLYMKNADLLCKQLAAVDAQKEAAIAQANQEAEEILEKARAEESRIIGEAREEADRINAAYEGRLEEAEEEVRRIREEGEARMQENEEEYQMLLDKKNALLETMMDINSDIAELISKVEESLYEE